MGTFKMANWLVRAMADILQSGKFHAWVVGYVGMATHLSALHERKARRDGINLMIYVVCMLSQRVGICSSTHMNAKQHPTGRK